MTLKNVKKEIKDIADSLKNYDEAKRWVITTDREIIRYCASSIKAAHKINSAIPENQDEMLKEAALMVGKACQKLKTGQRKIDKWYSNCSTNQIDFSDDKKMFININDQNELKKYENIAI